MTKIMLIRDQLLIFDDNIPHLRVTNTKLKSRINRLNSHTISDIQLFFFALSRIRIARTSSYSSRRTNKTTISAFKMILPSRQDTR